ncbi:MAG: hypothetical protein V3U87_07355, partial [Methylococcaceae bacterium]
DTDKIGFYRNRTQTQEAKKSLEIATDSRLGVQLDVDLNDYWHISSQFIARDHAGDFLEQNLDWAYLRWYPNEDTVVRAGRMGFDAFLLSDYRNVGFAYPWMRPPHEFYANIPISHYDGIDIKKSFSLDNGDFLSLKAFAGYISTQLSEEYYDTELEGPMAGANIMYEKGSWRFRAGYTYIRQIVDIDTRDLKLQINDPATNFLFPNLNQLARLITFKDSNIHFMSLGTSYDDGTWLAHAEASYMDTKGQDLFNPDTASAYLSIGRRFSNVTLYSLYGVSYSFQKKTNVPTPRFPEPRLLQLHQVVEERFNSQAINQQSLSIGLRWDFHPKVAFKAQWSHYWLGEDGDSLWYRDIGVDTPENVNVMSFGIDFIF